MDIRVSMDVSGMMARFDSLAAAAADPTKALLRCGGVVRSHAAKIFEQQGPNWPALDPVTQARKITAAEIAFLKTDHHGRSMVGPVLRLARQLQRGKISIEKAKTAKARDKAISKQADREQQAEALSLAFASRRLSSFAAMVKFAEAEKARKARHGKTLVAAKLASIDGKITDEQRKKAAAVGKRRYLAQGNADRVLGNLDKSLGMFVDGSKVKIFSKAKIGGIHNIGGTAGHDAKIPARPFMYIPNGMERTFAEIFREELVGAFIK